MSTNQPETIRFVAKSAGEAAEIVRRRLGPEGRVISVEQVSGSGLKRFISSPQLQIVAQRVAPPAPVQRVAPSVAVQGDASSVAVQDDAPSDAPMPVAPPAPASAASVAKGGVIDSADARTRIDCGTLLRGAGFSPSLIARLEGAERWREICALPAGKGLPEAIAWISKYRNRTKLASESGKVAFVGCAGVGKTTALCKYLAREAFVHGREVEVLQLEVDKPHLDTGLSIYCDILGVPCYDDPAQISGRGALLVDVPGVSCQSSDEVERLVQALDTIGVSDRVMVMNAAYELSVLEKHARVANQLGARYAAYTHLDELDDVSKLWSCILDPDRSTLFFARGQNVAGDLIHDSFGFMIERTFP
jgi:flagellar biosynthesis protein FlhF